LKALQAGKIYPPWRFLRVEVDCLAPPLLILSIVKSVAYRIGPAIGEVLAKRKSGEMREGSARKLEVSDERKQVQ
jgi:hypothetical protein